jgi:hypothetical protein
MSVTNHDRTYGHIDLSTGDKAPHVNRSYTLRTNIDGPMTWTFELPIPRTIDDALTPSDWDFVLGKFEEVEPLKTMSLVESIIVAGKLCGASVHEVQIEVGRQVAENLYRVFVLKQVAKGNKAWLRPSSMQTNRGGPNDGN